eukprot:s453_g8.t1
MHHLCQSRLPARKGFGVAYLPRAWRCLCDTAQRVAEYAAMKPTPVSIRSWLGEFAEPEQLPVPWQNFEELVAVHHLQVAAFQAFQEQPRSQWESVEAFRPVVQEVQQNDKKTKFLLMQAAQKMRGNSTSFTDPFSLELNKFLDDFLLSRLGCNMLMGQYLACTNRDSHITSIVNPQCDALDICRKAAEEVPLGSMWGQLAGMASGFRASGVTEILFAWDKYGECQGRVPTVHVSAYTSSGQAVNEDQVPRFSYIPGILMHVVRELLKNSCQASLELAKTQAELQQMPIDLVVCADVRHVVIRINDLAHGIPRHVGSRIWSYLYSGSPTAMTGLSFGYGIGLPLSRLHAKYLGGALDLVSLPGYGVDAYLSLPRVETDLVENIPDEDVDGGRVSQELNLLTSQLCRLYALVNKESMKWWVLLGITMVIPCHSWPNTAHNLHPCSFAVMDPDGAGCEGRDVVLVPRRLLREVIQDGCCPIHLRLQLARAMDDSSRMLKRHLESLEDTVLKELETTEVAESVEGVFVGSPAHSCGSDPKGPAALPLSMQSFYGAVAKSPEAPATNGYFSSGGSCGSSCAPRAEAGNSVQKSFYHQSHWSKVKAVPPPIFASANGAANGSAHGVTLQRRSDAALQLDRQLRGVETVSALMSLVTPSALPHFDVGNVVLAFTAAARVVDERTLSTLRFGYPAWNSLLSRVRDCVACLEPRGLAMVAHSAAKLGHKEMALWLELTRCASAKIEALTSSDLAKLCWAVSKLDLANEFPDFWQTMEDAVICAVASAQSVDLSMLAWAFGTAGARGREDEGLVEALARNALRLVEELGSDGTGRGWTTWGEISELTPQCLANICWAMARLGPAPPSAAAAAPALARRAEATVGDFVEPDVAHFCWGMAKLEQVDPELFDLLAEHTVRGGLVRRLTAPMASQLLWAFVTAEVLHLPLLEALANHVVRHVHVLDPAQLANACWCFATANFSTPSLLEAFASVCRGGKLSSFSASEFSAFVWGLAKLRPRDRRDDEVVPHLLQLSLGHLEDLDDTGLVNLLSSLVTLTCRGEKIDPQGHLEQLLDRVHQRFERRPPPDALALPLCRCFCRAGRRAQSQALPRHAEVLPQWEALAQQAPYEALRWACRFASGENLSLTDLPDFTPDAAGSAGAGRLWELDQLLRQLWRGRGERSVAETLRWMEDFGAEQCRELRLSLGTRAAIFDELTQQPSLLLELQAAGDGMLSSLLLAARLSSHGGRVLCVQEDPMHVAAARCVAELLGLSGSVEFLLGQPEDVLPQLLESHGRSAVQVLILRGGSEEAYLSDLKLVEELGLFTSGCILAEHMLRYGSPRFLQEMLARRHCLELVEVVDSRGLDWMALSTVAPSSAALPAPPAGPAGLAALTARVRRAWRGTPSAGEELEQRMLRCAREMGLSPSRRFVTASPLPSQACPATSSLRLPESEAEPTEPAEPVPGKSPRVAQEKIPR